MLAGIGFGAVIVALFLGGYGPAGALVVGFVLLTPLERVFWRHRQPVRRAGLRTDMAAPHSAMTNAHLLFTGLLTTAATIAAVVFWVIVTTPMTSLGTTAPMQAQPVWLQAILGFVLFEVLGYWAHRLLHQVPLFWRFHAVHHSSARLDWISAARSHPVDAFISTAIFVPPLLLLGVRGEALGALTIAVNLWAVLLHANVRWRFAWMDGWWGTPEFHHWHHRPPHLVVLDHGRILYAGTPAGLTATATGRVWRTESMPPAEPVGSRSAWGPAPPAGGLFPAGGLPALTWRTAEGWYRTIGTAPPGSVPAAPTLEDAYLLLVSKGPGDPSPPASWP